MSLLERLDKLESGCWCWNGPRDRQGYGRVGDGRLAHREIYREVKGNPDGFMILHSCDNPSCCNPDHLSLGTAKDNAQDAVRRGRFKGMSATHCSRGHAFTPENTYVQIGRASCRERV